MKEWICREISTATRDAENGILMMETELIRCKDCKFNEGYCENEDLHFHLEPLGLDGGALFETSPDLYCAYGKRKEEC